MRRESGSEVQSATATSKRPAAFGPTDLKRIEKMLDEGKYLRNVAGYYRISYSALRHLLAVAGWEIAPRLVPIKRVEVSTNAEHFRSPEIPADRAS